MRAIALGTSIPFGLWMPPLESETAITLGAFLVQELGQEAADVAEALDDDAQAVARHVALAQRLVDAVERRPARSPRADPASRRSLSGLPVTTPSTEWPLFIEYVSKIQAISRGEVPTSGAGMSFSGPISLMISLV